MKTLALLSVGMLAPGELTVDQRGGVIMRHGRTTVGYCVFSYGSGVDA